MNIQECYAVFGGDYADVKSRLMKDELIQRLVIKFLADESYNHLAAALEKKDFGEAFREAHTLKGLCQNFSFGSLGVSAAALTETLRKWESQPVDEAVCKEQWKAVVADYTVVADAIKQLKESNE